MSRKCLENLEDRNISRYFRENGIRIDFESNSNRINMLHQLLIIIIFTQFINIAALLDKLC